MTENVANIVSVEQGITDEDEYRHVANKFEELSCLSNIAIKYRVVEFED